MGNSSSGNQRATTTARPRRNPLLRPGLSQAGRQRLIATQARLAARGIRAR